MYIILLVFLALLGVGNIYIITLYKSKQKISAEKNITYTPSATGLYILFTHFTFIKTCQTLLRAWKQTVTHPCKHENNKTAWACPWSSWLKCSRFNLKKLPFSSISSWQFRQNTVPWHWQFIVIHPLHNYFHYRRTWDVFCEEKDFDSCQASVLPVLPTSVLNYVHQHPKIQ